MSQNIGDPLMESSSVNQEIREALKKEIASGIHVALPGRVIEYDSESKTATIRPMLRSRIGNSSMQLPTLRDVPVFLPPWAGEEVSIPAGAACLVIFADGCIDGWFESGSDAVPAFRRMHDLSDGFAFVGFYPKGS